MWLGALTSIRHLELWSSILKSIFKSLHCVFCLYALMMVAGQLLKCWQEKNFKYILRSYSVSEPYQSCCLSFVVWHAIVKLAQLVTPPCDLLSSVQHVPLSYCKPVTWTIAMYIIGLGCYIAIHTILSITITKQNIFALLGAVFRWMYVHVVPMFGMTGRIRPCSVHNA
jgi:hypothetical protein